ncbi:MAG: response regulator [Ktedonobacteraceae bacterium]
MIHFALNRKKLLMGKGVPGIDRYHLVVASMAEQWRILVIEGEENLNWNMVNSLQKDGYIVRGVTSGGEAIRLLWSEEYDVVICNQQMPDADGFDLLQWMRNYCPNARMVMLGTSGNTTTRTQALEMGVASYLEKPLDLHALKEELRRMLHSTGFSASLDSFDLLDVIQIITLSRKSIALVVNTGLEEQGILHFQNGELIWAEYGILRGEEAFYALAAHKNGTVAQRLWNEQITSNVTQPLSRLIFQALQYRSKYADTTQASSELEAIRPASSMALPPLPPSVFPEALQDLDEDDDDRPFQFVAEDLLVERSPASATLEQAIYDSSSALEQLGALQHTDSGSASKEWWEPVNPFPGMQQSGNLHAITDAPKRAPTLSSLTQRAVGAQNDTLPSWLTEQPTSQHLPILRGQTGQMPVVPKNWSPVTPETPPVPYQVSPVNAQGLPNLPQTAGSVWPEMPLNLAESGLRKIKPEEALYTGRQPAVRPNTNATRPSAEWQELEQAAMQNGYSGSLSAVKSETLHSLTAIKKTKSVVPADIHGMGISGEETPVANVMAEREWTQPFAKIASETSIPKVAITPDQPVSHNYPALAAALQTLGYSVPGFVASAVVSFDGIPIAQVTVDNLDISPLCTHVNQILQGALQTLQQGDWEPYEHTVLSSRTRHIVVRLIGNKQDIFQVLITTRETKPAESLEALANVEAAIAAALH